MRPKASQNSVLVIRTTVIALAMVMAWDAGAMNRGGRPRSSIQSRMPIVIEQQKKVDQIMQDADQPKKRVRFKVGPAKPEIPGAGYTYNPSARPRKSILKPKPTTEERPIPAHLGGGRPVRRPVSNPISSAQSTQVYSGKQVMNSSGGYGPSTTGGPQPYPATKRYVPSSQGGYQQPSNNAPLSPLDWVRQIFRSH